jgi:multiple sugar transport system ATP-binding protein
VRGWRIGSSMIYVTHDQVEAMTLADTIVVFNAGRIEQVGSPRELYSRPANTFVALFIGSPTMNVIPATVSGVNDGTISLSFSDGQHISVVRNAAGLTPGAEVLVGIRPEHVNALDAGQSHRNRLSRLDDALGTCKPRKG